MDYVPNRDADKLKWLTNIKEKLPIYATALGLTSAQVAALTALINGMISKLQAVVAAETALASAVAAKVAMESAELRTLRNDIGRWKTATSYSAAIGEALGVIGEEPDFDPGTYKPVLTASIEGDTIRLKFKKRGVDSVNIYWRRKGEKNWIFLARDTNSPYNHHITLKDASMPEHYEYIAYGVLKDEQIGLPSDIVQVVYGNIV